jgi:hypothetical protein
MSSPLGRVVQFPVRQGAGLAGSTANTTRAAFRRVTEEPPGHVDDWGRDAGLFRTVTMLSEMRWAVSTGGDQHLPASKGALIVVNARRFSMAHVYSAFAISRAVDRPVRFIGRPDDTTLGALAQRLGGLLDHPDEVAQQLRQASICSPQPPSAHRSAEEHASKLVRPSAAADDAEARSPNTNWPAPYANKSVCCSPRWATSTPGRRSIGFH